MADGGGLYLQVSSSGAKSWLFRFMLNGRAREMGLGSLRAVSLACAREKAAHCRALLAEGTDPIEAREAERSNELAAGRKTITFKEAADAYIAAHQSGWRNEKHASQWRNTLEAYAYPVFGRSLASEIDTGLVMQVLAPIWSEKTETANRVRGRIERVLDWATVSGYRQGQNPARWRGHLDNLLPKPSRLRKVRHHTAMPYHEVGDFVRQLRRYGGVAPRALEFVIFTAARTSEVIGATWDEVDLKLATWTVPAERMKGNREHRVPLVEPAVEALSSMRDLATGDHVFPGASPGRGLSNMALLAVLRRCGLAATVHGFRSSFRDWAAEETNFPREVAEQALAHSQPDSVEAAYRRGDLFSKRRRLMEAWAQYLEAQTAEVVALPTRRHGG